MARLLLEAKYSAGKQIMNTPQNRKTIQNVATCHLPLSNLHSIHVNQLSWNLKLRLKQNPLTCLARRVGYILWYTHLSPNLMMVMVMVVMHEMQVREVTSFATHFHLPIWPTHPHCPLTTPELCILHPLWTKAC